MRILIVGLSNTKGGIESFISNYIKTTKLLDKNIIFDSLTYGENAIEKGMKW